MITALVAFMPAPDAKTTLLEALGHYKTLKSFSMRIEQRNGSGLYPGTYSQQLSWRNDGRFVLKRLTNPTFDKDATRKQAAPDFYASNGEVVSIPADGPRRSESIVPRENTMPGWEVCGGPIFSFLQRTSLSTMLADPPPGMTLTYSFGPAHEYAGVPVRDIECRMATGAKVGETMHWYLAAGAPQLIAVSFEAKGQRGESRYLDQVENPVLPATLGDPPK